VVDGKIYVIGGDSGGDMLIVTVDVYDPLTDSWTTKADMPTPRGASGTSVVDGKIYAIGGVTHPLGQVVPAVEVYDPATNTWTQKADMPTARYIFSTSVVDGKIYVIGGALPPLVADRQGISLVEEYDPVTDTWTEKSPMPTARHSLATGVVNGIIYAIGGWKGDVFYGPTEAYDPATDT
jgi:N-acetylneuraminic acid mutarotase